MKKPTPYTLPAPNVPPAFLTRLLRGRELHELTADELRPLCFALAWHIAHLGPLVKAGKGQLRRIATARAANATTAPSLKALNHGAIERTIRAMLEDPAMARWPSKRIATEISERIERGEVEIIGGKGRRREYAATTLDRIVREVMSKIQHEKEAAAG